MIIRALSIGLLITLVGCTQYTETLDNKPEVSIQTVEKPFPAETLYALMVAELAANQEQFDITLGNYLEQAHKTKDMGVIMRAIRVARLLNARQALFDMGLLWLSLEPESAEANSLVAQELLYQKRPVQALSHVNKVLTTGDSLIVEYLAETPGLDSTTKQTLIDELIKLRAQYPKYPSIPSALAKLYQQEGQLAEAENAINQALRLDSEYPPAVIQKAQIIAEQDIDAATNYLAKVVKRKPESTQLRLMYAKLLSQTDLESAYEQFTTLSEQAPTQPEIAFSRAVIALELNQLVEAKTLLQQLHRINYRPDILPFYIGVVFEKLGDKNSAIAAYLSIAPGRDFIQSQQRAYILMGEIDQLDKAKTYFAKLREQNQSNSHVIYKAEGDALFTLTRYQDAEKLLNEAIQRHPNDIDLLYSRAMVYEKLDQLVKMEQDFRLILSIDPNNASSLNALGYLLADRTERFEEALALIEKAHQIRPEDPAILDSLGWIQYKLGNYQLAAELLQKAYQAFNDGEVAAHLGAAWWSLGEQEKAKALWQKYSEHPAVVKVKALLGVSS